MSHRSDSNGPGEEAARARETDLARAAFVRALRLDLSKMGLRERAVIDALCEEILHLREERERLQAALLHAAQLADRDPLVPLFNRRAFLREVRREIALADRFGHALTLIYIDLDGFKRVNDKFGHSTGDEVLRRLTEILIDRTRDTDVIGRLGGDEFGLLMPHADLSAGQAKSRELMEEIARLRVHAASDGTALRLGASCGVAAWRRGVDPGLLVAEADADMYAVKSVRRSSQA